MGGRGRILPINTKQLTLEEITLKEKIHEIIQKSAEIRAQNEPINIFPVFKKCACCENIVIPINTEFEFCPICGWIDDPFQNANPNNPNGRNDISLIEAKNKYFNSGV